MGLYAEYGFEVILMLSYQLSASQVEVHFIPIKASVLLSEVTI